MELRWVTHGTQEYLSLVELRRRVLRLPLGMDFTPEQLAGEVADLHLGAWEGRQLQGGLLLTDRGQGTIQMRQVCVEPTLQGSGVGAALVAESEAEARRRGFQRMILHARDTAVGFYLRLGYDEVGDPFEEVSIPHQEMAKDL